MKRLYVGLSFLIATLSNAALADQYTIAAKVINQIDINDNSNLAITPETLNIFRNGHGAVTLPDHSSFVIVGTNNKLDCLSKALSGLRDLTFVIETTPNAVIRDPFQRGGVPVYINAKDIAVCRIQVQNLR